jgi:hypothetical protein
LTSEIGTSLTSISGTPRFLDRGGVRNTIPGVADDCVVGREVGNAELAGGCFDGVTTKNVVSHPLDKVFGRIPYVRYKHDL